MSLLQVLGEGYIPAICLPAGPGRGVHILLYALPGTLVDVHTLLYALPGPLVGAQSCSCSTSSSRCAQLSVLCTRHVCHFCTFGPVPVPPSGLYSGPGKRKKREEQGRQEGPRGGLRGTLSRNSQKVVKVSKTSSQIKPRLLTVPGGERRL